MLLITCGQAKRSTATPGAALDLPHPRLRVDQNGSRDVVIIIGLVEEYVLPVARAWCIANRGRARSTYRRRRRGIRPFLDDARRGDAVLSA